MADERGKVKQVMEILQRYHTDRELGILPAAKEICQLFEPKAGEEGLLALEEIGRQIQYIMDNNAFPLEVLALALCQGIAKSQQDLTAAAKDAEYAIAIEQLQTTAREAIEDARHEGDADCQARVDEIFREIEGYMRTSAHSADIRLSMVVWQAFRAKYLEQEGGK